jgi:hypothetical protein
MTVLDAALLIAATAIGLALIRLTYPLLVWALDSPEANEFAVRTLLERVGIWVIITSPMLVAWTVVLPILRLMPPRPALRKLLRQPGMLACGGGVLIMAAGNITNLLVFTYFCFAMRWDYGLFTWFGLNVGQLFSAKVLTLTDLRQVGLFIAVVWPVQALTGRWRPAPDWVDRLGRALGFAWIATLPVFEWYAVWRCFY